MLDDTIYRTCHINQCDECFFIYSEKSTVRGVEQQRGGEDICLFSLSYLFQIKDERIPERSSQYECCNISQSFVRTTSQP